MKIRLIVSLSLSRSFSLSEELDVVLSSNKIHNGDILVSAKPDPREKNDRGNGQQDRCLPDA